MPDHLNSGVDLLNKERTLNRAPSISRQLKITVGGFEGGLSDVQCGAGALHTGIQRHSADGHDDDDDYDAHHYSYDHRRSIITMITVMMIIIIVMHEHGHGDNEDDDNNNNNKNIIVGGFEPQ